MDSKLINKLVDALSGDKSRVRVHEPMSSHTTFRIGGPAECMVMPGSIDEIREIIDIVKKENIPMFVMGNGSNLLVDDKGISGLVLKIDKNFSFVKVDGDVIVAQAGTFLSKVANVALDSSLTGFEFAAGIPGTIGGAIKMNAGAYGGEMKDVVDEVVCIDTQGNMYTLSNSQLDFSYRHSAIKDDMIVLEVKLKLKTGDKNEIKSVMQDLSNRRKEKQPLEYPSAGSTFKRPEGYFAGKLIQDSDLKGYSIGGAQVSEKHSGFVINKGNATFDDVYSLIQHIKETVYKLQGVELVEEVKIIK